MGSDPLQPGGLCGNEIVQGEVSQAQQGPIRGVYGESEGGEGEDRGRSIVFARDYSLIERRRWWASGGASVAENDNGEDEAEDDNREKGIFVISSDKDKFWSVECKMRSAEINTL